MSAITSYNLLLILHIAGGLVALICGYAAMIVKRGGPLHKQVGQIYVYGMSAVVLSALPMAVMRPNVMLFGIAVLSSYFVYAGVTAARNRNGEIRQGHKLAARGLFLASLAALIACALQYSGAGMNISQADLITSAVFAAIGLALAIFDLRAFRAGAVRGRERIGRHLIFMCSALISTTTAIAVTLSGYAPWIPPLVAWLGPTVIISPMIARWSRQVRAGKYQYG